MVFALGGCEWAIQEVSTPEFSKCVADWMRNRKNIEYTQELTTLLQRVEYIKEKLHSKE